MNKLNLNKVLRAGIFAATIITITACGGGGGGSGSSAPASTTITTIAGGGTSTTATDATQATLGSVYTIVAKDGKLLFDSDRDGTFKHQVLDLATNQLANPVAYSGLGSEERPSALFSASATKYYFWVFKSIDSSGVHALYEANSGLISTYIAGQKDTVGPGFIANDNGKLVSFRNPSFKAVLYQDKDATTSDQIFFTESSKIRKVTLSGSYPTVTVNPNSINDAGRVALMGDKLIVTSTRYNLIYEHDLKNNASERNIAGSLNGYENAENPLQAKLDEPLNIIISPSGNIYFTDFGVTSSNQRIIRKLEVKNGVYGAVTTAFGAAPGSTADNAALNNIYDLEFVGNNLYVVDAGADSKYRIKKIEFINQTP